MGILAVDQVGESTRALQGERNSKKRMGGDIRGSRERNKYLLSRRFTEFNCFLKNSP